MLQTGRPHRVPPGPQRRLGPGRAAAGRAAGRPARSRKLVHDAFAHRRKALAGSLALAPGAAPGIRERARAALDAIGQPARRAGRAAVAGGVHRAGPEAARLRLTARAPAKLNPSLLLGGVRDDGRHRLVTVFESVSLHDELELTVRDGDAGADEVVCPGVEGPNLVGAALAALRSQGWDGPGVRIEVRKRIPVAGRDGRRVGRRRRHAEARGGARAPAPTPRSAGSPPRSAPTCRASCGPGSRSGPAPGSSVEAVCALEPHAYVIVPLPFGLSTPDVYREADRLQLPRPDAELADALQRADRSAARPRRHAPARACGQRPRAGGDLAAPRDRARRWQMYASPARTGRSCAGRARRSRVRLRGRTRWPGRGSRLTRSHRRYPGACAAEPVGADFGLPQFA